MQLRPVEYQYNDSYSKLYNGSTWVDRIHRGLIGQEIQQVFPGMVSSVDVEGTQYLDLNLSNMQVHMVKAMQEQQKMINEQKKLILQLQQDLEKLKRAK